LAERSFYEILYTVTLVPFLMMLITTPFNFFYSFYVFDLKSSSEAILAAVALLLAGLSVGEAACLVLTACSDLVGQILPPHNCVQPILSQTSSCWFSYFLLVTNFKLGLVT
jgi:hypothetical protein